MGANPKIGLALLLLLSLVGCAVAHLWLFVDAVDIEQAVSEIFAGIELRLLTCVHNQHLLLLFNLTSQ